MNDDLISRKAVLEILYDISNRNYGSLFGYGINKACDFIEHAEIAFDKEKVIEEIKVIAAGYVMNYNCSPEYAQGCVDMSKKIIERIEKGGVR